MLSKKILFIDDGPGESSPEGRALAGAGHEVIRSRPGPTAVELAVRTVPDLIILDYKYGDQVSAYLCTLLTGKMALRGIPIILLSTKGGGLGDLRRDPKTFAAILPRPCPEKDLLDAVGRAAGGAGALPDPAGGAGEAGPGPEKAPDLVARGDIIGFPDLLQALWNGKVTGALDVSGPGNRIEVHLHEGLICFLNPRAIHLPYQEDQLCFSHLSFSMKSVEEKLRRSEGPGDSILFHMVREGWTSEAEMPEFMRAIGQEVLRECLFDPAACRFEFRRLERLESRFLAYDRLPVQTFLLRLSSHLDEWRFARMEIEEGLRFVAEPRAGEADLLERSDDQVVLLGVVEGPRTIAEVAAACRLSPFQAWSCLDRLREAGLVRKCRGRPGSVHPADASS